MRPPIAISMFLASCLCALSMPSGDGLVPISGSVSATISGTPTVDASGSTVDASGSTVSVTNTPNVNASGSTVDITNSIPVQLAGRTATRIAGLDGSTYWMITIDGAHHELHEGRFFSAQKKTTGTSMIMATHIAADAGKQGHFWVEWTAESKAHLELISGAAWTAGTGTACPIYNRNGWSTNTSIMQANLAGTWSNSMEVVCDPTGFTNGTVLDEFWTWSDKKQTSGARDENEWITGTNLTMAVRITSDDGSKGLHLKLKWYEIDPKEQ